MKNYKISFLIIIFSFFCCFSPLHSAIVNLSKTTRNCESASIAIYNNNAIVVWQQKEGAYNLYCAYYTNGVWSAPFRLFNTGVNSEYPRVDVDSNGRVHMAWMEGSSSYGREIYYASYYNGKVTKPEMVYYSPDNSCWPQLVVRGDDRIEVTWSHKTRSTKLNIHHNWKRTAWNRYGLDASRTPTITSIHNGLAARGNKLYCCWMQGVESGWFIYFSEFSSGRWGPVIKISGKWLGWFPSLCADSKGNVHVLFASLGRAFYVNRLSGVWQTPRAVPGFNQGKRPVGIDVDNNDILHGTWTQIRDGRENIYYSTADDQGNWTEPKIVSNGTDCRAPYIRAEKNGDYVHIVWVEGNVYYSKVEKGGGGEPPPPNRKPPVAIMSVNPVSGKPPLAVTFDASSSYDPDGTIESYAWDFGDGSEGSGKIVTHTYQRKGNYTITLTVMDNHGLTSITRGYVDVSLPPVAKFTMNPTTGVAPLAVHFDASASYDPDGTIKKYKWYYGDLKTAVGKKVAHTYHDAGEYTIVLEVFDNYAISTKASKRIKIHHVHPPINIQYNFKINRNLFTKECLYEITWEQNPLNQAHGVHVVLYRLLRKEKGSAQFDNVIAEVKSDTFVYLDRRLNESDENRYEYTVTAVDSLGNESVIGGLYLHNFPGNTKKEKTSKKIELKR